MTQKHIDQDRENLKARKFMMWLFLVSSFIFFAGLTSGFIVYTAGDPSRGIKILLPQVFKYSTAVIILSSISMHWAYLSGKRLQFSKQNLYLSITIILGIAFLLFQVQAWITLFNQGVTFVNPNASHSFIYVFTAAHLLHIIVGIILLFRAFTGKLTNVSPVRNNFRLEATSIFWHFIDILWIYLYVFLLLNQ
ncbi:heme-copper oxidase subunit III [Pedobacter sp. P351]|uniref:cytochrome c oxidase subunit 3 n=1 Tax=Pedobacter superstes TaxID=3133441 RepID=UPI0030A79E90